MAGVQLEKVNNIDIHLFLEKRMRGGVNYISKRYSKSDEQIHLCWILYFRIVKVVNVPISL